MLVDFLVKGILFLIWAASPSWTCIEEFLCLSGCGTTAKQRELQEQSIPVRILSFDIPTALVAGQNIVLHCDFETRNETLYAVKWYKDKGEFFRYVPRAEPKFKVLSQPGVQVDMRNSSPYSVRLLNLGITSHGNYTCQVSTDAPFFHCVQRTRLMDVEVPPADGPILFMEDDREGFLMKDNISIQCASGKGKPAPRLDWFVNGEHVDTGAIHVVVFPDNLERSSLSLRFQLLPETLMDGKIVLRCVSSSNRLRTAAFTEIVASETKFASADSDFETVYYVREITTLDLSVTSAGSMTICCDELAEPMFLWLAMVALPLVG